MSLFKGSGWKKGDNWAVCDVCGREFLASTLMKRWDGLVVCADDWEPRHPQEFVRAVKEDSRAKGYIRLEPAEEWHLPTCNSENRVAIAGVGIAGCMVADLDVNEGAPSGTFNTETL